MTVDTVQHCSPCSLNPETPSDVHVKMEEKDEGKMDPELKELKSSSAGTGFETPGQQCPNEGTLEAVRTTAAGFVTACVSSSKRGNIFSSTMESLCVDTRASTKSTATLADTSSPTERVKSARITADTTFMQQGHIPRSKENKQFDPGGNGEKAFALESGCNPTFFFWGELEGSLLVFCLCFVLCTLCVSVFPNY